MSEEPTTASPTEPEWSSLPVYRPLEPNDPRDVSGYRLRARLGEGGMGRVYLSYTPGGRPVALKIVRTEYADDPAFRRRFEHEIATAQRVQGIFTAPVIDANPRAPLPWLATAYVAGPSLQIAVGAYGPLPTESVLVLTAGVAEALQSIHGAGVVHRDLKPSNVILAADGPRVIDFGIARSVDTTSVTQTGVRVGTPAFMAPEQIRGRETTPAVDVFALGTLTYFAATGELPFGGGLDPAIPYRILQEEPDLAVCPEPLRELVRRCHAKEPRHRPTPTEVIELCRAASAGTRLQMGESWLPPVVAAAVNRVSSAPMPATPPTIRPRRSRGLAVTVAALVVVVAALTTYLVLDHGRTGTPSAGGPAVTGTSATTPVPVSVVGGASTGQGPGVPVTSVRPPATNYSLLYSNVAFVLPAQASASDSTYLDLDKQKVLISQTDEHTVIYMQWGPSPNSAAFSYNFSLYDNSAAWSVVHSSTLTPAQCVTAVDETPGPVSYGPNSLKVGTTMCVRTGSGAVGFFVITFIDPNTGEVHLTATLWSAAQS